MDVWVHLCFSKGWDRAQRSACDELDEGVEHDESAWNKLIGLNENRQHLKKLGTFPVRATRVHAAAAMPMSGAHLSSWLKR